jgi:hypothetical protein
MQFNVRNGPPSTWDSYGVDGNGDGRRSPYDPTDAIPAAARYLQAAGAPEDYRAALFAYNHADWYVAEVLAKAAEYRGAPQSGAGLSFDPATVRQVLRNPRIMLTPVQRADLLAGGIDPRLVSTLAAIGRRHSVVITALQSDHYPGTTTRPAARWTSAPSTARSAPASATAHVRNWYASSPPSRVRCAQPSSSTAGIPTGPWTRAASRALITATTSTGGWMHDGSGWVSAYEPPEANGWA